MNVILYKGPTPTGLADHITEILFEDAYAVKDQLKQHGFHWIPNERRWSLQLMNLPEIFQMLTTLILEDVITPEIFEGWYIRGYLKNDDTEFTSEQINQIAAHWGAEVAE